MSVLQCVCAACVCDYKICMFDQLPLSSDWCCSCLLLVYQIVVLVLIGESLCEPRSAHICHPTGIKCFLSLWGGGGGGGMNNSTGVRPFYIFRTYPT